MQNVQNLTNRKVFFQGVSIEPYATARFDRVTDYLQLSKLLNSGKVRVYVTKNVVEVKPAVTKTVEESKQEVIVEVPVEVEVESTNVVDEVENIETVESEKTETNVLDFGKKSAKRKSSKK